MQILTVVGARPQFVKAAALSDALMAAGHNHTLVHTGQHWDLGMSDVFFNELGLPAPSVNLGVGPGGGARRTARMRAGLEAVFRRRRPDWVIGRR
jgi:UDP-N-acetylglucosamine 2-epimerase